MPALLPLFYDVVNKRLVISALSPDPFLLPSLNQEDAYTIEFVALLPTGVPLGPIYQRINLAGYNLRISVGTAGVENTFNSAWAPNAENTSLSGVLQMNTAGINGLADGAQQTFEIRLFDGTNYNRGQFPVTIRKSVSIAGALVPVPGELALSATEARRLYVAKEGLPGEAIILTSKTSGKQVMLYVDDDGALQSPRIA
jgi:hypothetical protein